MAYATGDGSAGFYDMVAEPKQLTNLATEPSRAVEVARHDTMLEAWLTDPVNNQ